MKRFSHVIWAVAVSSLLASIFTIATNVYVYQRSQERLAAAELRGTIAYEQYRASMVNFCRTFRKFEKDQKQAFPELGRRCALLNE